MLICNNFLRKVTVIYAGRVTVMTKTGFQRILLKVSNKEDHSEYDKPECSGKAR